MNLELFIIKKIIIIKKLNIYRYILMCGCTSSNTINEINRSNNSFSNTAIHFDRYSKSTDFNLKYEYISTIGKGSYGIVGLYKDRKVKSMKYAIKSIKKDFFNLNSIENTLKEIEILRSLDHPNIVKYFESYEDENYLHIVMEYIPGESLYNIIKKNNNKKINFKEKEIKEIILNLLKVVSFLHKKKIVHRDLKLENILFSIPNDYSSLKIIDFGLSSNFTLKKEKFIVGTPYYMSPEMIEGIYHYKSDLWSIGVILYSLITGKYPFNGKDKNEVFSLINSGKYNKKNLNKKNYSIEAKNLIKKIFTIDLNKRISIEDALNDDWFKLTENENNNLIVNFDIIDALKNFQFNNLLKKEILYFFAKILKDSEIDKLKNIFSFIDKDNSGEINYENLKEMFKENNIDINEKELQKIFKSLDFHSYGSINYTEFIAATLSSIKFSIEEKLIAAFNYFDINNKGFITIDTIFEALIQNNINVDKIGLEKIFKDKKRKIEFFEFKRIFYEKNSIKTFF